MSNRWANLAQPAEDPRQGRRGEVELILLLAEHLPRAERELIEAVYLHGQSMAHVARLSQTPARTVQRRVQRLVNRMTDRRFAYVALRGDHLPSELRPVARRLILEGRTLRETAARTRRTLHEVRELRTRVLATIDAHVRDP